MMAADHIVIEVKDRQNWMVVDENVWNAHHNPQASDPLSWYKSKQFRIGLQNVDEKPGCYLAELCAAPLLGISPVKPWDTRKPMSAADRKRMDKQYLRELKNRSDRKSQESKKTKKKGRLSNILFTARDVDANALSLRDVEKFEEHSLSRRMKRGRESKRSTQDRRKRQSHGRSSKKRRSNRRTRSPSRSSSESLSDASRSRSRSRDHHRHRNDYALGHQEERVAEYEESESDDGF